jgi:hypothetical protein
MQYQSGLKRQGLLRPNLPDFIAVTILLAAEIVAIMAAFVVFPAAVVVAETEMETP